MVKKEIRMPQLGESVTEGTVSNWIVKIGDQVDKYDPIAEVLTDKVNAEVPSSYGGTITELVADEGETIAVGDLMCYMEVDGTLQDHIANSTQTASGEQQQVNAPSSDQSMKKRYSPAVLRLAQENEIDLEQVDGSGRGGRITRKDIERIIESGRIPTTQPVDTPVERVEVEQDHPNLSNKIETGPGDKEIPVTGIRKAIAENMVRSKREIPHAWMMIEVDVTNMVKYRNSQKDAFKENEGYNLSFYAFFLDAVAKGLKKFPQLNSTWAGDKIILRKDINLSIAVAREQELFVPVIKHVDEKSIKGIAKEIHELAQKARTGKLKPKDMEGGTFTVNNTGSFGSVESVGVINYPQAAILQVESIIKKPVIIDDMFAARDMVNLCLSLDHRVLDGVICGQFMNHIKGILEGISPDNTPIY